MLLQSSLQKKIYPHNCLLRCTYRRVILFYKKLYGVKKIHVDRRASRNPIGASAFALCWKRLSDSDVKRGERREGREETRASSERGVCAAVRVRVRGCVCVLSKKLGLGGDGKSAKLKV